MLLEGNFFLYLEMRFNNFTDDKESGNVQGESSEK